MTATLSGDGRRRAQRTAPGPCTAGRVAHGALASALGLGFVLAAPLRDATPAEAEAVIGALVLVNDFSARDDRRAATASGLGPQKSKRILSSMSATAVTPEEILPRINELSGTVRINGTTVSTVSGRGWHALDRRPGPCVRLPQ